MERPPSRAILIAAVTASLPEDQSAAAFVNKADCFLPPGSADPLQLLLDPRHSADRKIHTEAEKSRCHPADTAATLEKEMEKYLTVFFNLHSS